MLKFTPKNYISFLIPFYVLLFIVPLKCLSDFFASVHSHCHQQSRATNNSSRAFCCSFLISSTVPTLFLLLFVFYNATNHVTFIGKSLQWFHIFPVIMSMLHPKSIHQTYCNGSFHCVFILLVYKHCLQNRDKVR